MYEQEIILGFSVKSPNPGFIFVSPPIYFIFGLRLSSELFFCVDGSDIHGTGARAPTGVAGIATFFPTRPGNCSRRLREKYGWLSCFFCFFFCLGCWPPAVYNRSSQPDQNPTGSNFGRRAMMQASGGDIHAAFVNCVSALQNVWIKVRLMATTRRYQLFAQGPRSRPQKRRRSSVGVRCGPPPNRQKHFIQFPGVFHGFFPVMET